MTQRRYEQDSWRAALATRVNESDGGVPGALARRPQARGIGRATFLGGLGLALAGAATGLMDYVWPHGVRPPGEVAAAGNIKDVPVGGPPVLSKKQDFWLVNLDPADKGDDGSGGGSGLLALWRKCPHLGCAIPWQENIDPPPGGKLQGRDWFHCPCHGSTYTKAGVRVFGPAPRSMDTALVSIDENGNITVDTRKITQGGLDNPKRALKMRG
jgi:cytochrome b6-f complex iron-sulfur subunit